MTGVGRVYERSARLDGNLLFYPCQFVSQLKLNKVPCLDIYYHRGNLQLNFVMNPMLPYREYRKLWNIAQLINKVSGWNYH